MLPKIVSNCLLIAPPPIDREPSSYFPVPRIFLARNASNVLGATNKIDNLLLFSSSPGRAPAYRPLWPMANVALGFHSRSVKSLAHTACEMDAMPSASEAMRPSQSRQRIETAPEKMFVRAKLILNSSSGVNRS
jgi:hypothetical protein